VFKNSEPANGRYLIGSDSSDFILKFTIIQTISDRYENGPIIAQPNVPGCQSRSADIFKDKLSFPTKKRRKAMKRGKMTFMTVLITVVLMSAIPLAAMASEPVTIQGEVNDSYQIVDSSGQVYEIAETEKGNDLVENHIGEKAKVVGTLQQDQDVKIITITAFEILAE